MSKQKLSWTTGVREVKDLLPWRENPRKISKIALDKLKEKITQNGFHSVIVIDTDNTILSGNQRKTALMELGVGTVDVMIPSRKLTNTERSRIGIESNINDGDWDYDLLKSFDMDLLLDSGFDQLDLSNIWDDVVKTKDEDFDEDKELKKIKQPITKSGDLIILGKHRLICGDSSDPEVLKRLCGDDKVSMIYSDPPYNIKLDYDKGVSGKQSYGGEVNDNLSDNEYKSFLNQTLSTSLNFTLPDCHVFYWCDQSYIWLLQTIYKELGITNKRVCLWIKNGHSPTPHTAFNKCYEPCVYGIKGSPYLSKKKQALTEVLNLEMTTGNDLLDEVDIWTNKRLNSKNYEHATSKPPTLHDKAILRCTKPDDIILDSFLGSGSTLIAGEQLKRRVYGVERQPIFCDLIIKRFEHLTGNKAIIDHEKI